MTDELKIIGAGFGRTGTLSIKAALEELGFGPCYHMTEVFSHPAHASVWEAAAKGEPINWQEVLTGYQATVDWPGCTFYQELMKVYPDTKVLLTVRDPEKWYESVQSTIFQITTRTRTPLARLFLRLFRPTMHQSVQMINTLVWEGTFGGNFADKQYAIEIFNQHIEEVKKYVPPEQLLVYNVNSSFLTRSESWPRSPARISRTALITVVVIATLSFILSRQRNAAITKGS
ncbi:MAG: sulfotransferase family protein [Chloroflexi bacterium]|nr:MAG: sulfotransferase family protein [Chloroflexota bacterium]